ncbi:aspartate/glutamate racemase family protein [Peptoniphilus grossensis]|uniref:aspartate/glutamate racemase family protein n=1 Tax=Peptoniphilus grossensis TaxID=1465756 RepID=UPI0002E79DE5|nr:aspartate/glutamate racemase family protein [Peptoniphilus grossensis]
MKVLLINPNSNDEMTNNLNRLVDNFTLDNIETDVIGMKNTPEFIGSQETINKTFNSLKKSILENKDKYEIFILACHLDPNLQALREETKQTILGIGECSLLFCKMLGKRFSIVGSSEKTVELKNDMVSRYGAEDCLDYIGYPEGDSSESLVDRLSDASKKAIDNHNSDVIVLGCAGFVDFDSYIESKIDRDVIDGVIVSLMIADNYAKYKNYKKINY